MRYTVEQIEVGARALAESNVPNSWGTISEKLRDSYRGHALTVLDAVFKLLPDDPIEQSLDWDPANWWQLQNRTLRDS